jgi:hypothetical protein
MRITRRDLGILTLGPGWEQAAVMVFLFTVVALPAYAQLDRAQISGVVQNQRGGVIPGATVTATNQATQLSNTAVTNETGYYVFPHLVPGVYDIAAQLQGFKKHVRTGLQVDAAGRVALDLTLEAGTLTDSVTAESVPLRNDVAVRMTITAKDIEMMSFNGRNPIGIAALKAGVVGGNFNNLAFASLGNGAFNINGSRPDENTIAIDGGVAIRTRSSGAIIGIPDVDALQEVQVLTANYLPEYGRASGGQIRFVTKSGSSRYNGSASFFYKDDSLQANSWSRNRSPNAAENSGPATFDQKQYGYAFGGPVAVKGWREKLFFFGAQEWVDFFQVQTSIVTVPTLAMRDGDFSELLNPENSFFGSVRRITDPLTGQPFPGNIIPATRLSKNGTAFLRTYPPPTEGFLQGSANTIITSENPQDQRKDNLRLDFRASDKNAFAYRISHHTWAAIEAFRDGLPLARTEGSRPNTTQVANWTSTLRSNLITETSYSFSIDKVFLSLFTGTGLYKRSVEGIDYPYIFAGKEIDDKIPTILIAGGFQTINGGPYSAFSEGPIHTWSSVTTYVKGRHTFKAGAIVEYSGEDDFDQIGPINQNGRFEFRDDRAGGTGLAIANVALGLFSNYAEIDQPALTKWRALATDVFVQDSWRPTSTLTIEGGIRWGFWPPWYSVTNNIAHFDPRFYDTANQAAVNPSTGRLIGGPRYNGIVLPGDGFEGDGKNLVVAQDPSVLALFRGQPRGFSESHYDAIQPRLGLAYQVNDNTVFRASAGVFHNRVTLNDSTLLGGNQPFQGQVTISNGNVDNPGGGGSGANDLPFAMTAQDVVFKHPTAYTWSGGVQRELPFKFIVEVNYVGRTGLYLQRERNLNQLQPGAIQANPGVNIAALRPYRGYADIRLSENAGRSHYHSLQITADRRYSNGFQVGTAYTLGKSEDNASDKRNVLWNTYDDKTYWGPSNFDRRHNLIIYYIYDLPFFREQNGLMSNLLGGWQVSGAMLMRTGTPFTPTRNNDIAGVGDGFFGQPIDLVGDIDANTNKKFSAGPGQDSNFYFNPNAFADPARGTFGNAPRNLLRNPGDQQWDLAVFKNFRVGWARRAQFRADFFNFPNHPNLVGPNADRANANFGRSTQKIGSRDIQLSLRFFF